MKPVAVWIQDVDGRWEQVGTGTMRGITPANVELNSDSWGPKQATFDLQRETWAAWPDIQAYAPVDVWVSGKMVWSGRVTEAPTDESNRSIVVRCEGWQAHLDDDQYERTYLRTDMTKFVDVRSELEADLSYWHANGLVNTGGSAIKIGWPVGTPVTAGNHIGVVMDMGVGNAVKEVRVDMHRGPGSPSGLAMYVRTSPSVGELTNNYENASFSNYALSGMATTSTRFEGTFAYDHRFLCIFLYCTAGYTPGLDDGIIIEAVHAATSTAYWDSVTNHASTLGGDTVVKDAKVRATMLLSSDDTQVSAQASTDYYMPEYDPEGPRTPRQAVEGVNAFYDYLTKVDERKRLHFRPRPTTPSVKIGQWGTSSFNDASSASAEGVVNKVIVTGNDPSGKPLSLTTYSASQSTRGQLADPYFPNSNFATDTTGWNTINTTITRYSLTTAQDADGYGIRWDLTGASDNLLPDYYSPGTAHGLYTTFAGSNQFKAGTTYVVAFRAYGQTGAVTLRTSFGQIGNNLTIVDIPITVGSWNSYFVLWTPIRDCSAASADLYFGPTITPAPAGFMAMDAFTLYAPNITIVDRRKFLKAFNLSASFMLTPTSAARLASMYLAAHRVSPFKGQGQVVGNSGLRDYSHGDPVAPEDLLRLTSELIHFDNVIDPDTGNVGRDGKLTNVSYRPLTDTATFDIDNTRGDFDALLSRVGVQVGQIR